MTDTTILQNNTHVIKPKKSVALSGVPAGNTALCTVGKSGNDLHYRGYDILDLAEHCEFEEVAHLLIHGKLPTRDELNAYKSKLKALRGLPANVRTVLEALPAAISCICCMVKSQPKAGKKRCIFRWCCMPSMSSTPRRLPAG